MRESPVFLKRKSTHCEKILPKPEQLRTYDESLKVYWDHYSVIETAKYEGRQGGKLKVKFQMYRPVCRVREGRL